MGLCPRSDPERFEVSKKLQEKQRRRLAEQARRAQQQKAARRSNMLTAGIAIVVVVAVAALIVNDRQASSTPVPAGVAADAAGCGEVRDFPEVSREHIEVGQQHEAYNSSPPTSGPHYQVPADPGFYPSPLPPEQLVHNLEHGQIVIWYRPDAPEGTIEGLQALVEQANARAQASGFVEPLLASPYDDIAGDSNLVLTAWTRLRSCVSYSREAIDRFRAQFQGRGPEQVGVPPFSG
jgi:uncharacterized protein DUF3105